MVRKRIILGAGQCGMKLAHSYFLAFPRPNQELIGLSTSTEDSVGIPKSSLVQIAVEGSGKKFSTGTDIWLNNFEKISYELSDITDSDIVYFSSTGGGSGSSSVRYISDIILTEQKNNRVFLILVLPFAYENLPFKPNTLRCISAVQDTGYADKMSIMLFDNSRLAKIYFDDATNLEKINQHIINHTSLILDLINVYHDPTKFSPFTIDEIEHESVIFSKGFIGIDTRVYGDTVTPVKFDYGKLQDAKNIIIAKVVKLRDSDYLIRNNSGIFLERVKSISRKAKNARIMYGIVRTDKIADATYIIIANNLDINNYIGKVRGNVERNVESFLAKDQREKILTTKEKNLFDI